MPPLVVLDQQDLVKHRHVQKGNAAGSCQHVQDAQRLVGLCGFLTAHSFFLQGSRRVRRNCFGRSWRAWVLWLFRGRREETFQRVDELIADVTGDLRRLGFSPFY